jgi:hypothetical protein
VYADSLELNDYGDMDSRGRIEMVIEGLHSGDMVVLLDGTGEPGANAVLWSKSPLRLPSPLPPTEHAQFRCRTMPHRAGQRSYQS